VRKGQRNVAVIKAVVIAPYDDFNKFRFIEEYKLSDCVENSLEFYTGLLYDVMLIAQSLHTQDTIIYELKKYLAEQALQPERGKMLV
jgi:hypothetical protein